jgi:hypothetical protein
MATLQYSIVIPMRFATAATLDNFLPQANCSQPLCSQITSSSPDVYTSDFQAAYWWQVFNAADGETIAVNATDPNGKLHTYVQLTYSGGLSTCYQGTGWVDNYGEIFCGPAGAGDFVTGINVTCGPVGAWTLGLYDNGNPTPYSVPFNLVHSATSLLGITAPTDNEIFDLDQQNFTSTDPVPFSAGTVTGNSINWAVTVNYATSGGYGAFSNTLPSFQTASGATQNQTFQSEGGQVRVIASTTASDGSPVQDCVTFYIDGVQSPSPLDPTTQLLNLYTSRLLTKAFDYSVS